MSTYPELNLYIDGEWRKAASDLPVLNPATEEEIGRLPHADKGDLDDALDAAVKGFDRWRQVAPVERANVLLRAAALTYVSAALMSLLNIARWLVILRR